MSTRSQRLAKSLKIRDQKRQDLRIHHWDKIGKYLGTGLFLLLISIWYFGFGLMRVDGPSMEGTLYHNQWRIISKWTTPKRGDVITLLEREKPEDEGKLIVKRLIGLPGDVIQNHKGQVTVNGEPLAEPYVLEANRQQFDQAEWEITVPEGHVFVMGDNRDISKDSRTVGSFKQSAIIGTVLQGGN